MSGSLLLDTNAVIAIFANDRAALDLLRANDECLLPSTVLGELYFGAAHSAKSIENRKRIDRFSSSIAVLPSDAVTAAHYGRIKNELKVAGSPIPENDIWIASIAVQYNLTLMSNDRHFDNIRGLTRAAW